MKVGEHGRRCLPDVAAVICGQQLVTKSFPNCTEDEVESLWHEEMVLECETELMLVKGFHTHTTHPFALSCIALGLPALPQTEKVNNLL